LDGDGGDGNGEHDDQPEGASPGEGSSPPYDGDDVAVNVIAGAVMLPEMKIVRVTRIARATKMPMCEKKGGRGGVWNLLDKFIYVYLNNVFNLHRL
jgi:hypothetical protein